MLNTLFGEAVAKVSKTPGRTRQINIFKVASLDVATSYWSLQYCTVSS